MSAPAEIRLSLMSVAGRDGRTNGFRNADPRLVQRNPVSRGQDLHPVAKMEYRLVAMGISIRIARVLACCTFQMVVGCGPSGRAADATQVAPVEVLASDVIDIRGNRGVYVNGDNGAKSEIMFPIALDRVNVGYFHDVERIGTTGRLIAVLDTYGSRGAGERCADGRESWLRIFSLAAQRQVEAIPVESCRDGIRAGQPPVTWHDDRFEVAGSRPRRFVVEGERVRLLNGGGR